MLVLLLPGVCSASQIRKILDHFFSSNIASVTFFFLPVPQITLVLKLFTMSDKSLMLFCIFYPLNYLRFSLDVFL